MIAVLYLKMCTFISGGPGQKYDLFAIKETHQHMKLQLFVALLFFILVVSCKHSTSLSDQLKINFAAHLKLIDSALTLDSFRLIGTRTMTQRFGRIIDDSIYVRELYRVKEQLANALKAGKNDSAAFYQQEVDYMVPNIDSLTNSISKGDTTRKFGTLVACDALIRLTNASQQMLVVYILDENMNIINPDMVDDMIKGAYEHMK